MAGILFTRLPFALPSQPSAGDGFKLRHPCQRRQTGPAFPLLLRRWDEYILATLFSLHQLCFLVLSHFVTRSVLALVAGLLSACVQSETRPLLRPPLILILTSTALFYTASISPTIRGQEPQPKQRGSYLTRSCFAVTWPFHSVQARW